MARKSKQQLPNDFLGAVRKKLGLSEDVPAPRVQNHVPPRVWSYSDHATGTMTMQRHKIKRDQRLIETDFELFDRLETNAGMAAAKQNAANHAWASLMYLEHCVGTRAAYELFQQLADELAARTVAQQIGRHKDDPQP
jgi:hypothetical protein